MRNIDGFIIYCLYDSDRDNLEALNKGYRSDIYVEIQSHYYHLNIYDIARLKQDFEMEVGMYGFYSIDPNVVIVQEVEWTCIRQTISKLKLQLYFERILPVSEKELLSLDLKEKLI
jgi:hypothetical protein